MQPNQLEGPLLYPTNDDESAIVAKRRRLSSTQEPNGLNDSEAKLEHIETGRPTPKRRCLNSSNDLVALISSQNGPWWHPSIPHLPNSHSPNSHPPFTPSDKHFLHTVWDKESNVANQPSSNNSHRIHSISAKIVAGVGASFGLETSPTDINQPALEVLARCIEFRLRLLIQESQKFSRRSFSSISKGSFLSVHNVFSAMESLHIALTVGSSFSSVAGVHRPSLRGSETAAIRHASLRHNDVNPEEPVNLHTLALTVPKATPMPRIRLCWVAVDGKLVAGPTSCSDPPKDTTPQYRVKLRQSFGLGAAKPGNCESSDSRSGQNLQASISSLSVVAQVDRVVHPISREHIMLLQQLKEVLRRPLRTPAAEYSEAVLRAIQAIQTSSGLRQLVPYLVAFEVSQIYAALRPGSLCPAAGVRVAIRALVALAKNQSIDLHLLVHQVVQVIQLVVIHPLLGCSSMGVQEASTLRLLAAQSLSHIVALFSGGEGGYVGVGAAVVDVYSRILHDAEQPVTTLLGAVIGVRCLGRRTVQAVLLPLLPYLVELVCLATGSEIGNIALFPQLNESEGLDSSVVQEVSTLLVIELLGAVADTMSPAKSDFAGLLDTHASLQLSHTTVQSLKVAVDRLWESLGDAMIPLTAQGYRHANGHDTAPPTMDWADAMI